MWYKACTPVFWHKLFYDSGAIALVNMPHSFSITLCFCVFFRHFSHYKLCDLMRNRKFGIGQWPEKHTCQKNIFKMPEKYTSEMQKNAGIFLLCFFVHFWMPKNVVCEEALMFFQTNHLVAFSVLLCSNGNFSHLQQFSYFGLLANSWQLDCNILRTSNTLF